MGCERRDYLAFMLRLWRANGGEGSQGERWRASLESPQTQEKFTFVNLVELFTFLEQEVEQMDGADPCQTKDRLTS